MEISKENFEKVMLEHFTGVGNEYDEEEDIESFKGIMEDIWEGLEKNQPYVVISKDLSDNPCSKDVFQARENLVKALEEGDWSSFVILAVFDPQGIDVMEEFDEHIHDENH